MRKTIKIFFVFFFGYLKYLHEFIVFLPSCHTMGLNSSSMLQDEDVVQIKKETGCKRLRFTFKKLP